MEQKMRRQSYGDSGQADEFFALGGVSVEIQDW